MANLQETWSEDGSYRIWSFGITRIANVGARTGSCNAFNLQLVPAPSDLIRSVGWVLWMFANLELAQIYTGKNHRCLNRIFKMYLITFSKACLRGWPLHKISVFREFLIRNYKNIKKNHRIYFYVCLLINFIHLYIYKHLCIIYKCFPIQ